MEVAKKMNLFFSFQYRRNNKPAEVGESPFNN
jgi:hypothetical protein